MDIKSKKFSHSIFVKVIIYLILLGTVLAGIYAAINIYKHTEGNIEMIAEASYLESNTFRMEYEYTIDRLTSLINTYGSEAAIKKGKNINEDYLQGIIEEKYWDDEALWHDKEIYEKEKQKAIEEDLRAFKSLQKELQQKKELVYYVTDGKQTYTNTKQKSREQFEQYPAFYISEGSDRIKHPASLDAMDYYYDYDIVEVYDSDDDREIEIYAGYTEEFIDAATDEWQVQKNKVMDAFYILLASLALFVLCALYLMITTGRHAFGDDKLQMQFIDRLYVDINLGLIGSLLLAWFIFGVELNRLSVLIYPVSIIVVTLVIVLGLSLIRHLKNRTFLKHMVIYTVLHFLFRLLKDVYDSGSVGMKIIVVVILYPLITAASLILFPVTIGLAVWLAMKKVKAFQAIQGGTKLMTAGNLDHKIIVDGTGEFATLAANINGINEGFKEAVHNELKNERMKTELITNVSHDIRTPLTSFITYTDLLKMETDPEKIASYIEILDQKSKRLQQLTDDLFAAAKASSGDIPVNLQQIDIVALLNQGIGEVSEQIAKKDLVMKMNHPEEKMYVIADGKLLWRSIENILSNIFRYALEGSRVYIDITEENDRILICFKNMSKYELNISEAALMERFKRGDDARTSQGSGLGLSITKSLIENQGGTFTIKIDGDLFKSIIELPKATEEISIDG